MRNESVLRPLSTHAPDILVTSIELETNPHGRLLSYTTYPVLRMLSRS